MNVLRKHYDDYEQHVEQGNENDRDENMRKHDIELSNIGSGIRKRRKETRYGERQHHGTENVEERHKIVSMHS